MSVSLASWRETLLALDKDERDAFLDSLDADEHRALLASWAVWARPEQLAPAWDWHVWVALAGRGWGKTRTGAEWVIEQAKTPGTRIALLGKTPKDIREVMLEGESGILACSQAHGWIPKCNITTGSLEWDNGSIALSFSGEVPDQLRGPQFHKAWVDEWAKFKYPVEVWDQLQFTLRLGRLPQTLVTTTPRSLAILRQVLKEATTAISTGSTFDNTALPASFLTAIRKRYEGTSLGQQELFAAILDDTEGALWKRDLLESLRVRSVPLDDDGAPDLVSVVIGADPAVTSNGEDSDETGLVSVGLGRDGHGYILEDYSGLGAFHLHVPKIVELWRADKLDLIVGEVNNGGDLVEHAVRTARDREDKPAGLSIPFKKVHASRGKAKRAEPVAMLYQQRRVHHVGMFPDLEDQMCTWVPGVSTESPDRMDALVWALTELLVSPEPTLRVRRL